jgi:hypothetical protein
MRAIRSMSASQQKKYHTHQHMQHSKCDSPTVLKYHVYNIKESGTFFYLLRATGIGPEQTRRKGRKL